MNDREQLMVKHTAVNAVMDDTRVSIALFITMLSPSKTLTLKYFSDQKTFALKFSLNLGINSKAGNLIFIIDSLFF